MRELDILLIGRKIGFWITLSLFLILIYFTGYITSAINQTMGFLLAFLIIIFLLGIILAISLFYKKNLKIKIIKRINIWLMLFINLIFAFIIGFSIPTMQTHYKENMGVVMIPLLIILNYIIIDRFHFYLEEEKNKIPQAIQKKGKKRPIIEYEGKKYHFSIASILAIAIGAPLLAWIIYIYFDNVYNYWLHEVVVKQTAFFLRSLLNIKVEVTYNPIGKYHWGFSFPDPLGDINFETFCTGIQAICVFTGIIVFIPHSKDPTTKKDVIWRKTKSLITSSVLFYIVNIIRMLIQLDLYYIGYRWEDIHYSISAASSFIAAIIILLLHKWIPEFIISIIYVGTFITEPLKIKRKETIIGEITKFNKVNLNLIRKTLGMKSNIFKKKFPSIAKNYNLEIRENYLIVPKEKINQFIEILENKFTPQPQSEQKGSS